MTGYLHPQETYVAVARCLALTSPNYGDEQEYDLGSEPNAMAFAKKLQRDPDWDQVRVYRKFTIYEDLPIPLDKQEAGSRRGG